MSRRVIRNLRRKIDQFDSDILKLLNHRARVAIQIGKLKASRQEEFYTPSREKILIERLKKKNKGPFPTHALQTVWREILSASRALNAPLTVAYLGPEATFTHMAALKHFGRSCEMIPAISIPRVFDEVENNRAHCGVVGIENSTEGVVGATLDRFLDSPLKIIAEVTLPIRHNFLSRSGTLRGIRKIYSHPQAIGQCRVWLEDHFPHTAVVETDSTSQAASRASEEASTGAIASEEAAHFYQLKIAQRHIEDNPNNITRFLILSRKSPGRTGRDKTSILFSVKDEVGILYRMLKPFYDAGINLTKIESRPLKKKAWEYIFFLDIDGHIEERRVSQAVKALEGHCLFAKVLGSYPKATT
jgi:chorismate mutase/prephenate dehydratase